MFDIRQIITNVRENGIKRFEYNAGYTNIDEGKYMITFMSIKKGVHKVNDWGREEDEDEFIGLDKEGWILYKHDIENGAGPIKIKNEFERRLSDEEVYAYIQGDLYNNKEFLSFMSTAYKFYQ